MTLLCQILGCDFAMTFGGQVTSHCLRCGCECDENFQPLSFYTIK